MTYKLSVCHPNDIIHGRWQCIEKFESRLVALDWKESPTIDCYRTMCIHIFDEDALTRVGAWVFDGQKFVSVSSPSILHTAVSSDFSEASKIFCREKDVFEQWIYNDSSWRMLNPLILSMRTRSITRLMCKMAFHSIPYLRIENSQKCKDALEIALRYCDGEVGWMDVKNAQQKCGSSDENRAHSAIYWATYLPAANFDDQRASVRYLLENMAFMFKPIQLANMVRENLPFHEVIECLLSK